MKITKGYACSNNLNSALGVRLYCLLHKSLVTVYTCMPKQVVSLKDSASNTTHNIHVKRGVGEGRSGFRHMGRPLSHSQGDKTALRAVGDSSPMGELPCSRNF
ncbi:hypothetical protein Taro_002762 [Colocasia esculenta]|uniref:Uncharacterized protein n=1 Tax=Colocasia esculenta TaxID=4460 RepID=A0A843TDM6_COLES|nr:hypothetical protein [Colocasia esculenta]